MLREGSEDYSRVSKTPFEDLEYIKVSQEEHDQYLQDYKRDIGITDFLIGYAYKK
jgi:hypothetical protein